MKNFGSTPISKAKQISFLHGTPKENIPGILKKGLEPKEQSKGVPPRISLTTSPDFARYYTATKEERYPKEKRPTLLKITLPREEFLNDPQLSPEFQEDSLKGTKPHIQREFLVYKQIPPNYIKPIRPSQTKFEKTVDYPETISEKQRHEKEAFNKFKEMFK